MSIQHKVACVYNKHFFETIYKAMIKEQHDTVIDASNTFWHILDVEEILIKEFGYRRLSSGGIGA